MRFGFWPPKPVATRVGSLFLLKQVPSITMLEKRRYAQGNLDNYGRSLMFECLGHPNIYQAIFTQPVSDDGDV